MMFWDLKLGNSSLPIVSTLRILGVKFSHDLSWKTLCEIMRRKVTSMIGTIIHCFGHILNFNSRKQMLAAFAPHIYTFLPTSLGKQ